MKVHMKTIQQIFWIAIPILLFFSLGLFSLSQKADFGTILQRIPGVTITFLFSCLFLLYAGCLLMIKQDSQHQGTLKTFLLIASIQQLSTLNIIGAIISFLYYRQVEAKPVPVAYLYFSTKWLGVLLSLITLVSLLLTWVLFFKSFLGT